ncbi:MAG: hypothetical protein IPH77_19710 [Ignavibacteria bacterium]|nr:hypothetical protein [Ignavibacteria bacterium]
MNILWKLTDNSGKTVRSDIRTTKFRSLDMLKKGRDDKKIRRPILNQN